MQNISINLLPKELRVSREQEVRKSKFNKLSVGFLILTIILTVGVLLLKTTQVFNTRSINREIKDTQQKIGNYKTEEGLLYMLQDRLDTIQSTNSKASGPVLAFNLTEKLLVPGITINSFNVDKSNNIQLTGQADSLDSLQKFFNNLVDSSQNEGRIMNVKINSLGRGLSSNVIFDLTLFQNTPSDVTLP